MHGSLHIAAHRNGLLEHVPFSSACWDCSGKVTQCLYQRRQNPLPVMYVFILKLNILMYYLFLKCHGIDSELSPPGRPLKLKE